MHYYPIFQTIMQLLPKQFAEPTLCNTRILHTLPILHHVSVGELATCEEYI